MPKRFLARGYAVNPILIPSFSLKEKVMRTRIIQSQFAVDSYATICYIKSPIFILSRIGKRFTAMILPVHKKQLFKLFLAFYFLFFSVSPLTYALSNALSEKQEPGIIPVAVKTSPGIKSLHVSAWTSCSGASTEETPSDARKTRVLIKKKRAIAPEDFSENIPLFTNGSAPLAQAAYRSNVTPENILDINQGFNPLYAGNSPPSV